MQQNIDQLVDSALRAVEAAADLRALDEVRVDYLGKKGSLTEQMKTLGRLSPDERPKAGDLINRAKQSVQEAINARRHVTAEPGVAERMGRLDQSRLRATISPASLV